MNGKLSSSLFKHSKRGSWSSFRRWKPLKNTKPIHSIFGWRNYYFWNTISPVVPANKPEYSRVIEFLSKYFSFTIWWILTHAMSIFIISSSFRIEFLASKRNSYFHWRRKYTNCRYSEWKQKNPSNVSRPSISDSLIWYQLDVGSGETAFGRRINTRFTVLLIFDIESRRWTVKTVNKHICYCLELSYTHLWHRQRLCTDICPA